MKKLGLIILVAVMALGALGAAYAAWSQNLNVAAAVNTGNLAAVYGGSNVTGVSTDGYSSYSTTGTGTDTLTITITNAYPGATYTIPFAVNNMGSIPIGSVAVGTWSDTTVGINPGTSQPYANDVIVSAWVVPAGSIAINGYATGGSITISVLDTAAMNGNYTITANFVAKQ
jgi:hypothetical protein